MQVFLILEHTYITLTLVVRILKKTLFLCVSSLRQMPHFLSLTINILHALTVIYDLDIYIWYTYMPENSKKHLLHSLFQNAWAKMRLLLLLLLLCVCLFVVDPASANPDAKRLYENLLANYDRWADKRVFYTIQPFHTRLLLESP